MAQLRSKDYNADGSEKSKYEDHTTVIRCLESAQEPDQDNRNKVREAKLFLNKRNGQWEEGWWNTSDGKPRYTFDKTSPIVEQICVHLEKQDFAINVHPADGETAEDDADLIAGIVRSIENNSQAKQLIYSPVGRGVTVGGIDGWEVVQRYEDGDSFDQDLAFEKVYNWEDRVWFDPQSERQDKADSEFAFKMTAFTKKAFKDKFPKRQTNGSIESPGLRSSNSYFYQKNLIIVGTIYYVKEEMRELAKMSDGSVYEVTDEFIGQLDQMQQAGITIEMTRKRPRRVVYTRMFDGNGWLGKPQKTVFSYIPLIPAYGNYKIIENKEIYWGAVEKMLDPQRVYNYAMSRHVEEVALAPRKKLWLTEKMVEGYGSSIQTLNTNTHPVQFFQPDDRMPGFLPAETGGPQVNEGILALAGEMSNNLSHTSGMFAANMGDNPNLQSGVAIEALQDRGDDGNTIYLTAMEIAIAHAFRVTVDAIPRVYTKQRQLRILNEDMTNEVVTVNQVELDPQTFEQKVLRDLTKGKFSVTCRAGPSYINRQEKTARALLDIAQVKPEAIDMAADIFFKSLPFPGADQVSERFRRQLFLSGMIPFEQLTDKERQELEMMQQQQSEQGGQPDPNMLIAQAEMMNAENDRMELQIKAQDSQAQAQSAQAKLQETYMRLSLDGRKQGFSEQQFQFQQMIEAQREQRAETQALYQNMKTLAETLDKIQESLGKDVAMRSPAAYQAYEGTAGELNNL